MKRFESHFLSPEISYLVGNAIKSTVKLLQNRNSLFSSVSFAFFFFSAKKHLKPILTSSLTSLVRSSFESFVLARFFTRHLTFLCGNIYLGVTICSVRFSTFVITVILRGKVSNGICSVLSYLRVFVQPRQKLLPTETSFTSQNKIG